MNPSEISLSFFAYWGRETSTTKVADFIQRALRERFLLITKGLKLVRAWNDFKRSEKTWNKLPLQVKNAENLSVLKLMIKAWDSVSFKHNIRRKF